MLNSKKLLFLRKITWIVIIVGNQSILKKLVGSCMAALQRVIGKNGAMHDSNKFVRGNKGVTQGINKHLHWETHEILSLKHLLSHLDSSSDAISNFMKLGSASSSYLAFWIIASKANRHMTDSYFVNYSLCSNQDSVPIADGSFTLISRTCIVCTPNIKLSFSLHIPHFPIIFCLSVL